MAGKERRQSGTRDEEHGTSEEGNVEVGGDFLGVEIGVVSEV